MSITSSSSSSSWISSLIIGGSSLPIIAALYHGYEHYRYGRYRVINPYDQSIIPLSSILSSIISPSPLNSLSIITLSPSTTGKPIIAVDIDEVLGFFISPLLEFYNNYYSHRPLPNNINIPITIADMHSYHFSDVWGGNDIETAEIVHRYFDSKYFFDIPEVPNAAFVLNQLKNYCYFIVITSRQHVLEELTKKWIQKHYPGIFEKILFGNHYGFSGKKYTKAELCQSVQAEILIDDSIHYAMNAAPVLDHMILFDYQGSYAWNKEYSLRKTKKHLSSLPNNIIRVYSWHQVGKIIESHIQWKSKRNNQTGASTSTSGKEESKE